MARLRYNGLTAQLGAALTNSGTTITFTAGLTHSGGTNVPTISGSDYIPLTIMSSGNVSEIVYLTAYTAAATTGTITRGQETTSGVAHSNGDAVVHAPTVKDWTDVIMVAVSDETTAITTGTAKVTFRMPYAMTLTKVKASLSTASTSGIPAVNLKESGTTVFSTTLTIDANEKTSETAATAAVISDANLADDAEMTIDIDTAGTGAKGLKVYLLGVRL